MPLPQSQQPEISAASRAHYGGWGMHTQEIQKSLGPGQGVPTFFSGEWPNFIKHLTRLWSPGLGAQGSATSYGWPYEDITLNLVPPPVPAMQMMVRGSMAALRRPGGGSGDFGSSAYVPATKVPINYSRPGY